MSMIRDVVVPCVATCLIMMPLQPVSANSAAKGEALAVSHITLKLFSQTDGSVRPFDKPPNLYGMDVQVLVDIEVSGQLSNALTLARLELQVNAPGWSDEATGSHERWHSTQTLRFAGAAPSDDEADAKHQPPQARHLAFLLPWQACYPEVSIKATVRWGKHSQAKTITTTFACSE